MMDDARVLPDERLRLIFICCHPAVAIEARAALTLRWRDVLRLYDRLLEVRDDNIVRLNRAVAVAEVDGPDVALAEISRPGSAVLDDFLPYHAVRADLLRRRGRMREASATCTRALALDPPAAERLWLERQAAEVPSS